MITESFDNTTEPIINMEEFYGQRKHLLDICLVVFSKSIYETILEMYACRQIAEIYAVNGVTPIYCFTHEEKDIAFYLSPLGSAGCAQDVIEANWMTGARHFIMFGSAGSLDGEKTDGKFVIPTEAYRDEGMSYHYAPPADYIRVKNHGFVADVCRELNIPFVEGRVWTTDAFLRETIGLYQKRKDEGCIAVEMEVAGVQAVCDFYGFMLYDFLATGDVLSEESYDAEGLKDANNNINKFHLALEIARRL